MDRYQGDHYLLYQDTKIFPKIFKSIYLSSRVMPFDSYFFLALSNIWFYVFSSAFKCLVNMNFKHCWIQMNGHLELEDYLACLVSSPCFNPRFNNLHGSKMTPQKTIVCLSTARLELLTLQTVQPPRSSWLPLLIFLFCRKV